MSSTTQVGKGSMVTKRNGSVFEVADEFGFIGIIFLCVKGQGFGFGGRTHGKFVFFSGDFQYAIFNFLEIGIGYFMFAKINIIVKSSFDGRTNRQFDAAVDFLQRLRQYVRGGVPKRFFAIGVVPSI